jgi:hypothetical protein
MSVLYSCISALVLLAEEKAETIVEVEELLKQAFKAAEAQLKRNQQMVREGHKDSVSDPVQSAPDVCNSCKCIVSRSAVLLEHDVNVCVYIRRRLAMCTRKLGRCREAVKIMKDVGHICGCQLRCDCRVGLQLYVVL